MISEYHLIYKLVNLKTCKIFKNNFKKKLQLLTCPFLKKPKPIITFIFTGTLKIEFFNHVFMLFFYFNNIDPFAFQTLINYFNIYVASQIPFFITKKPASPDLTTIQTFLTKISYENPHLKLWIDATKTSIKQPWITFIINNQAIDHKIKTKITNLCHISGKMWSLLSCNNKNKHKNDEKIYYHFGSLLMLYYLFYLEMQVSDKLSAKTTWNLQAFFTESDFFSYYLATIDQFSICLQKIAKTNFNCYFRVINVVLNNSYG